MTVDAGVTRKVLMIGLTRSGECRCEGFPGCPRVMDVEIRELEEVETILKDYPCLDIHSAKLYTIGA